MTEEQLLPLVPSIVADTAAEVIMQPLLSGVVLASVQN